MTLNNNKHASKRTPRQTVLVVEDNPHINLAYRERLSDHFHVIAVRTGSSAVETARRNSNIHLVLLDYRLPDMTGIDVLNEIRKSLPTVPVILVTGHGSEDVAVRSFRSGVSDYIKKPFTYDDLISRMEALVCDGTCQNSGTTLKLADHEGASDADSSGLSSQHIVKIKRVIQYIDQNYRSEIDLEEAARIGCMSPCHFSRLFRKIRGIGFKEHLHRKRIEKAIELLHNRTLSVAEIAYGVGYADLTHFERIFKKATNLNPTAYRNKLPK